jgi:hypothetical protein
MPHTAPAPHALPVHALPVHALSVLGIVDSGGASAAPDARRFRLTGAGAVVREPAGPDRLGHGTRVEAVVRRALPDAVIRHAQVFDDRPVTTAAQVAAAVDWLSGSGARVLCLSLGLAADRSVLRDACAAAQAAGAILVAAAPARGAPCYPAALPGVIAATGDARCGFDQISALGADAPAAFGAWCGSPEQGGDLSGDRRSGGASLGCARIAAHVLALLDADPGAGAPQIVAALTARAAHRGPERRGVPA